MYMGACVCVWDQTATLGIILGLCLIFICLKQDVSLIWTIPRTLDWMATASVTLIWDYKWASLPIPFLKGELRIMPWPLCLRSSTLLNSRNTILTLCGILLENYFSGSHSGFLLPLLQVWCHFNVIDKYISFPLLLNSDDSHCPSWPLTEQLHQPLRSPMFLCLLYPHHFFFVGKLCRHTMTNSTSWASQSCAYTSNKIWHYIFFFPCRLL